MYVRNYIQQHQEELRNGADPTGMLDELNRSIYVDMTDSVDSGSLTETNTFTCW